MYQPQSTPEDELQDLQDNLVKKGFQFFELTRFLRSCYYDGKTEFKITFKDIDHATVSVVNHVWQTFDIDF